MLDLRQLALLIAASSLVLSLFHPLTDITRNHKRRLNEIIARSPLAVEE
ncbi:hypothetical protein [Roseibacillus ishigakijimensis]|uniref:Uncharacterized protein n=1 Tax=Roseibacillus ishigakijimensis TaxID=454146 RepID=A0A934RP92_9BACT|nr:hypothetical protein [Roseibacillus ishigakijimensis]MBK1835477.1 hypothetical protein [Roseibacillus ishigakijimensis]